MIACFDILARPAAGSLERILRTVRSRGFRVVDLRVNLHPPTGGYRVTMEVVGERDPQMLRRQLSKLPDVEDAADESGLHGATHGEAGSQPAVAVG